MRHDCIGCEHHKSLCCELLANIVGLTDEYECVLNYPGISNLKEGTFEHFVFYNTPVTYLRWLSKTYIRELETDDEVVTLRGGFGSTCSGRILTIIDKLNRGAYLARDNNGCVYEIQRNWWEDVFKLLKK